MLMPDQFRVNEAWIAVRINEEFMFVKDEQYDMYVLMDAASAYVLGHVVSRVVDESPREKDVEDLFEKAWAAKKSMGRKTHYSGRVYCGQGVQKQGRGKGSNRW